MNKINNFSSTNGVLYFKKLPNESTSEKKNSFITNQSVIGFSVGVGLTALAASGICAVKNKRIKSPSLVYDNISNVLDKIRESTSIMEVLKESNLTPKNFKQLMFNITSDKSLSKSFIKEVTAEPRKSKEQVRFLTEKIGGEKELKDWMLHKGGYQEAYYRYTNDLYNTPNIGPDALIKQSPNWTIWSLKSKFGDDFCFGHPPKAFKGVDNYRNVFKELINKKQKTFGEIKLAEEIAEGESGKSVIRFDADGKKYILKYQKSDAWHNNKDIRDDLSMKSDSTFIDAQLDRYLCLNGNTEGPKLVFFDYKTNSAIYEMTEGKLSKTDEIFDILNVNDRLQDINSLGVYYNDLNQGNFRVLENGELNFIDSGEASFVDFFKPGVERLHFSLPNLSGRSLTDTSAAINLAKS